MTATEATTLDPQHLAVLFEGVLDPAGSLRVEILDNGAETPIPVYAKAWAVDLSVGRVRIDSNDPGFLDSIGDLLEKLGGSSRDATEISTQDAASPVLETVAVLDAGEVVATVHPIGSANSKHGGTTDQGSGGLLSLGMLRDVPLEVSAELGSTRMSVSDVLQLRVGSIIELDRAAGAPVDVIVNGASIAKGEVVVIDEEYGVRITDILGRVSDTIQ